MDELRGYLIKNFSLLFLTIFTPLFAIASVVFMIKLATYTAVIKLTLLEMFKLYLFVLPELFFYTLPITFFAAATLTLFRFSTDNEIVVFFSLGIHPSFIYKVFAIPATLLVLLLYLDFFFVFPHANVMTHNLIEFKKGEAKFNLSASEFGHKFGSWMLYIGEKVDESNFKEIILFQKENEQELFINAKRARIINNRGLLKLHLEDGEAYNYSEDKLSQINFESMNINDVMTSQLREYQVGLDYWLSDYRRDAKIKEFITRTLISVFPIITLLLVLSFGIAHVRHQKSKVYLYIFLTIILYFALSLALIDIIQFYTIFVMIVSTWSLSYFIYKRNILARF